MPRASPCDVPQALPTQAAEIPPQPDAGLGHIKEMANLKTLGLSNTRVTDFGVAKLQKALPNYKISK